MHCLLLLFVAFFPIAHASTAKKLVLPVGTVRAIDVPGLIRVAVGRSRLLKVKAIPPSEILLTAKKEGVTTLLVWTKFGKQHYRIEIISLEEQHRRARHGLVRVYLEFLEIDEALGNEMGVQWPESMSFYGRGVWQGGPSTSGLNYSAAFKTAEGFLKFLVSEGWAKIVAQPELYVRLGEEALFHAGGEFPVLTTVGGYGHLHKRVNWKPYGISVKVKPKLVDEIFFQTEIDVEISEILSRQTVESVPALSRRKIQTKVDMLDGETVILSGLVKQVARMNSVGLEGLSRIPIFGMFFSTEKQKSSKTEMMLVLTLSRVYRRESQKRLQSLRRKVP